MPHNQSHPHSDSHSHTHSHPHHHSSYEGTDERGIRTAFVINVSFTVLEIVGGVWTNSVAILADAVHDLGDSFALGSAWYLERYSRRRGDLRFSYGYRRFSLLGALISTTVLLVGSLLVLMKSIPRLFAPESTHASGMLLFAVVGILANGIAAWRLRGRAGLNARVVAWHLLEDVLGWFAILAVSVILLFKDLPVLDPALSILITLYVGYNVLRNARSTLNILLQGTPESLDLSAIEEKLESVPGVQAVHHTHVWSLDGERHVLTVHATVNADADLEMLKSIKQEIRAVLCTENIVHSTIELELAGEDCAMPETVCRQRDPAAQREDTDCTAGRRLSGPGPGRLMP